MPDHEFAYPTVVEIVRPPAAADGDRDFLPMETPSSRRHDTHCAGVWEGYTLRAGTLQAPCAQLDPPSPRVRRVRRRQADPHLVAVVN